MDPHGSSGDLMSPHLQLPVLVLACVSGLVLLVSFLGCVGSCRQSRCLVALVSLPACLTLLCSVLCLSVHLPAGSDGGHRLLLHGGPPATHRCLPSPPLACPAASLRLSMERYRRDNLSRGLWDTMQGRLRCCGALSIDDWSTVGFTENCRWGRGGVAGVKDSHAAHRGAARWSSLWTTPS